MCAVGNTQGNTLDSNVSFAYESAQPVAARHTTFTDTGSFKVTVVIDFEYSSFWIFQILLSAFRGESEQSDAYVQTS